MVTAKSNFCSSNKTSSFFFDCVNVRFITARIKTNTLKNFFTGNIRSDEKFKSVFAECIQCVLNQCLFKKYCIILKIVEFWTRNFCSPVKIKKVKFFCNLNMIFWFKIKLAWSSNLFNFKVFCIEFSNRCIWMNHVWNLAGSFFKSFFCFCNFFINYCNLVFYFFTSSNKLLTFCIVKFLFHCFCVFITLLLKFLLLCNQSSSFVIKFYNFVSICCHISVFNILFNSFKIVFYKFIIKHFILLLFLFKIICNFYCC